MEELVRVALKKCSCPKTVNIYVNNFKYWFIYFITSIFFKFKFKFKFMLK